MELSTSVHKHPNPQTKERTSSMFKLPDLSSPPPAIPPGTEPRFTQGRIWIRTIPRRKYWKRLVEKENLRSFYTE